MPKTRIRMTKAEKVRLEQLKTDFQDDRQCVSVAILLNQERFSEHRGACGFGDDATLHCVIFGNDGFQTDVRARKEVAEVTHRLHELGIDILGFGVEPGGYSWAMRVDCDDEQLLDYIVWDVWFDITCPHANPIKDRLADYLGKAGSVAA